MRPLIHGFHLNNLRGDIYGGIVAAVVALPLALAFGVTSGAGAIAGLYGAIFVGFFSALFGGTPAQVSGPTGPMTVVMAEVLLLYVHRPALAFTVVILGGALQILIGLLKWGRFIRLVPFPVISGFMSGIGCIILILQIPALLGHAPKPEGVVATLQAIPVFLADLNSEAVGLTVLSLGIISMTPARMARWVPPPVLALLIGTLVAYFWLPEAPVIGEVPKGFPSPIMPALQADLLLVMLESAVSLALLGTVDSLLTALICDNLTRVHHDSDRECIGQGIGNMVAGFFGGLPGAGATMRSVVNIRTGGRTPLSGMLHALLLLAILLGLGPLAENIPLAVLAGILLKVGIDIIDWWFVRHVVHAPRADVMIMVVVLGLTVFVDLIRAVGVGVVLASLLFVKRMGELEESRLRIITRDVPEPPLGPEEAAVLARNNGRIILIHIDGPMSFGSANNMVRRLERVREFSTFSSVVLDLSGVPFIDTSAAKAVEDMIRMTREHGQHLFFVGMQPQLTNILQALDVLSLIQSDHHYARRLDALRHAAFMAGSQHPDDRPTACVDKESLPPAPEMSQGDRAKPA
jgi:SulP family sulfate permease